MMGWRIYIDAADIPDGGVITNKGYPKLATWETRADGLDWMDRLVEDGRAVQVLRGGYPNRYKAKAADVLPLLSNGGIIPPKTGVLIVGLDEGEEYVHPPGWMGKVELDHDAIAACSPDQVLTITAWDQS